MHTQGIKEAPAKREIAKLLLRIMKKRHSSSVDRISELPRNIKNTILMLLPMRDMVRTSILSKDWRFQWAKVPQLIFADDRKMFQSRKANVIDNLNIVFAVLLQHQGPICKFTLDMSRWYSCSGIDKVIHFLSRNRIQELSLSMSSVNCYKLPSLIFSCVELKHLSLRCCVFQPLALVGFNKLVTLELVKVKLDPTVSISGCSFLRCLKLEILSDVHLFKIDAPNLNSMCVEACISSICFMKTPPLKVLSMTARHGRFNFLETKSSFAKIIRSLPLLENLRLFHMFVRLRAAGGYQDEFPATRSNLKMLQLSGIDLSSKVELSTVLWLISSSPNLQKLVFKQSGGPIYWQPELSLQILDCYKCCLMKLRKVEFELASNFRTCFKFFKFLLAISPELEALHIKPALDHDIDLSCCKSFLKLACTPRASPKAEIVFVGLDLDKA